MKKKVFLLIAFILFITAVPLLADDGTWNANFSIQGGSIYSETENNEISMEKELLLFDGKKTVVYFQFRNTTNRTVQVDCGFPVQHLLSVRDMGDILWIEGRITETVEKYFETRQIYDPNDEDQADEFWGIDPLGILKNNFNNKREFISLEKAFPEVSFYLEQDGRPVAVKDVLLERRADQGAAWITFHFRHSLTFAPGAVSTVKVEYTQDLASGHDGAFTEYFSWNYIIDTGATWKGKIASILFIFPSSWEEDVPGLSRLWETEGYTVFGGRDYIPRKGDRFSLSRESKAQYQRYEFMDEVFPRMKKMWVSRSPKSQAPARPAQDFVHSISASSFLPDKLAVFHQEEVIENAGFGPVSAFDGIGETSWCENVPADGLGEYLECEISRPVWGLVVKKGFTRFHNRDWMFEKYYLDNFFRKKVEDTALGLRDYFTLNNRVKELSISVPGGEVLYTLNLSDRRDPQFFAGISLAPGKYRFTIRSVYPGTQWKDTCLAELTFIPAGSGEIKTFWEDSFYRKLLAAHSF